MFINCGDKNFFEYGRLVDAEHYDETEPGSTIHILACDPFTDEEDLYLFGDCEVDITDDWIDRDAVLNFLGMSEEDFEPVSFALGCVDYYGVENWDNYNGNHGMSKKEIENILKYHLIASDNLDITW